MTPEKYAMIERERMEGAKTVQSKTVDAANETRGYPPGKCQRKTASNTINQSTRRKVRKIMEKMFLRVSDVEEILGVSESLTKKCRIWDFRPYREELIQNSSMSISIRLRIMRGGMHNAGL